MGPFFNLSKVKKRKELYSQRTYTRVISSHPHRAWGIGGGQVSLSPFYLPQRLRRCWGGGHEVTYLFRGQERDPYFLLPTQTVLFLWIHAACLQIHLPPNSQIQAAF